MRTTKIGPDLRLQRHRTRTRRSLIEHRAETFGREGLIWWIKSQSSLLKIYFHLFTSATHQIHFTRAMHRSFAQNLSAIFEIGEAQLPSVTEIALKSSSLCVNRSLTRYGFRAGARVIRRCKHSLIHLFLSSLKPKTQGSNESRVYWTTNKIYIYSFFSIACRSNDSPNNCTVFLLYYYF